ncbi:MAG: response regulator [Burkholderiales bacterium]|nr:response regulator [Burkholderiales bacterium]
MSKPTVLVVDDEPLNVAVLSELLSPQYRVLGARSGPDALELLHSERLDLVLLDVMMPDMDGYAVLAALRGHARGAALPVIFVTALGAEADEERGLLLGAADYVTKPIKPAVVLARVRAQLELRAARERLQDQNEWLEREVRRRTRESEIAQDLTLSALAELAETRDNDTGNHIVRTQAYVQALGRRLQRLPGWASELDDGGLERIVKAAPLHDIGKIGIPDHILLKPARLSTAEFEQMKKHCVIGGDALAHAMQRAVALHPQDGEVPEPARYLQAACTIAYFHHERWDGGGYPRGLAGPAIPRPARLMALADVYDALATRRVYKDAWTPEATARYITEQSGLQFDPDVAEAFAAIRDEFEAIASRLAD